MQLVTEWHAIAAVVMRVQKFDHPERVWEEQKLLIGTGAIEDSASGVDVGVCMC
jgi:hypothetical protein